MKEYDFQLADGVLTIQSNIVAKRQFQGWKNIHSVVFSGEVLLIEDYAFSECPNLQEVVFEEEVGRIGIGAFCDTGLMRVQFCDPVHEIGMCAFADNPDLDTVVFDGGVGALGYESFAECPSLKQITVPAPLLSIGGGAFRGCTGLEAVSLEGLANVVGDHLFKECVSLKRVSLPMRLLNLPGNVFEGCANLEYVVMPDILTESTRQTVFADCPRIV